MAAPSAGQPAVPLPASTIAFPVTALTTSVTSALSTLPSGANDPASSLNSLSVCIGHDIDNQSIGVLASFVLSSAVGLVLWLLFAFLRPRFRQLYALREWFVEPQNRPKPLSNRPWSFLSPYVPLIPPTAAASLDEKPTNPHGATHRLLSEQELMQRFMWTTFLICLGWCLLGIGVALPLYLVNTPCVAQTGPSVRFRGQISALEDLSLLRLLLLLDNKDINLTSANPQLNLREIIDGKDRTPNTKIRLVILTAFIIILGLFPAAWILFKEFNRLIRHREHWFSTKCDSLDLAWLSIEKAPGFRGWGEQKLKEFLHKNGLGPTLLGGFNHNTGQPCGYDKSTVSVTGVFSIVDAPTLRHLTAERIQILERLEEAETQYIASFRLATPDPSLAEEFPVIPEAKPYISRPRMLGVIAQNRRRRSQQHAHPPSYIAPSPYYRIREPRLHRNDGAAGNQNLLSQIIEERLTGSRFKEVNRDSSLYDPFPLGSALHVGETGDLEPIPEDEPQLVPSGSGRWTNRNQLFPVPESLLLGHDMPKGARLPVPSDVESFPMRRPMEHHSPEPPHLRTQIDRPFVRPLSGIDNDSLSMVYDEIRHWRSRLKAINNEVANNQQDAYLNISEGHNITGWLLTGRNLRCLPGVEMIEGRSKSDIRWARLQNRETEYGSLAFWTTVVFIGIALGASLLAVVGLALANAPEISHFLPFLQPLTRERHLASSLATALVPAILFVFFIALALCSVGVAANCTSLASRSRSQFYALKASFYLLTIVSAVWITGAGSVFFAMGSFAEGSHRLETVAHGSIYMGILILTVFLTAAFIFPALLLLQPSQVWKVWQKEHLALTPRQHFKAYYPRSYNPVIAVGCGISGIVFAAIFAVIFPLVGLAIILLLFLTLIAHRYLSGYSYSQVGVGQAGGLLQIWLIRRLASITTLQPLVVGLLFLSQSLWVLGGILTGAGILFGIAAEAYAFFRIRTVSRNRLTTLSRQSLVLFQHVSSTVPPASERNSGVLKSGSHADDEGSLASRERVSQLRSRGSLASILEMMSITLATMPSNARKRLAVPIESEDLDDLIATDRAARTHPSAPPHLPPLAFEDRAKETSDVLYVPELLIEPPAVWLPNDHNGIALAEAYDLQRYHGLGVVLDIRKYEDPLAVQR